MTMSNLVLAAGDPGSSIDISDAFYVGVGALGVVALAIGACLLIALLYFAMHGMTPLAIICGSALLTLLLGPGLMLVVAIVALIVLAIMHNIPPAVQIFAGWLLGTIIVVIAAIALAAIGAITL